MRLLGTILQAVNPTIHSVTDGAVVKLTSGAGAVFDPDDLDASTGTGDSCTVSCGAPWPYRAEGIPFEAGRMRISVDGQANGLTLTPEAGMLAEIDGRTYTVVEAQHDLDSNDWLLVLEGAG